MRALVVLLVVLVASGCVSQKKYLALENDYQGVERSLAEKEKAIVDRDQEIANFEARVQALDARVAELDAAVARRQAELDDLHGRQASLLIDKGRLKADVESMRKALADLQARRDAAEAQLAAYRDLLSRFQRLIDAGKLRVKIVEGRMVVELATDVLFSSGSADLSTDGKAAIDEVARVLATIPDRHFQVEGHTDNDPIRTAQYPSNWELAAGRALTVVRTMIAAGMPAARVSAASYAESKPVAPNETPAGKQANRRIEIVVVPDLSGLPGYDELQAIGTGGR
jgi:chemotaxis protein MotB